MGAQVVETIKEKPSQQAVDAKVNEQKAKGYLKDTDIKALPKDTEAAMKYLDLTDGKGKKIDDQKARGILDAKTEAIIKAMSPEDALVSLRINHKMHEPRNIKYLTAVQKETLAKMKPTDALTWLTRNDDKYRAIQDAVRNKLIKAEDFEKYTSGDPQNTIDELRMMQEASEEGDKKKAEIALDDALSKLA